MPKGQRGSKAPHGTWARYVGHGCRCDVCRGHSRETKRRYREAHPDYNARQSEARMRRYHDAA